MEFKTEPLSALHRFDGFDCGEPPLNDYLRKFALSNQAAGVARSYAVLLEEQVIGYYSLSAGSVDPAAASVRLRKGLPKHQSIPVVLLGRLGVDRSQQGRGLGKLLLRDAVLRFLQAAQIIGARALLVHAKNDRVARFYAGLGFEPLPTNPLHVALLLKDAQLTATA